MAALRFTFPAPPFPVRSLQELPGTVLLPRLRLATRLHPPTMFITHRRDARGSAFAVLPVFNVFVLFHLRPCDDEASEVPEEPGAAGDRDEHAELPCDDALDPSVV